MKLSELFYGAADLIDETGFTKGAFARNKRGEKANPLESNAACFCGMGALRRVTNSVTSMKIAMAETAFAEVVGTNVVSFNDAAETTKNDMVAAFRIVADICVEKEKVAA